VYRSKPTKPLHKLQLTTLIQNWIGKVGLKEKEGVGGVVGDDGQAACQREIFQGIARK